MAYHVQGAGRAITDYFNSPAYQPLRESELLEAILAELMRSGTPLSNDAIITSVIARFGEDADETLLEGYRSRLMQIFDGGQARATETG